MFSMLYNSKVLAILEVKWYVTALDSYVTMTYYCYYMLCGKNVLIQLNIGFLLLYLAFCEYTLYYQCNRKDEKTYVGILG